MKKIALFLMLLSLVSLPACVTLIPMSGTVSEKDYFGNQGPTTPCSSTSEKGGN